MDFTQIPPFFLYFPLLLRSNLEPFPFDQVPCIVLQGYVYLRLCEDDLQGVTLI